MLPRRGGAQESALRFPPKAEVWAGGVGAAARRLPRWQRGPAWTRAEWGVPRAPPRLRPALPLPPNTPLSGRRAQCRLRRRAQEAAALARRRRRSAPGTRRRAAGHGPAQGPPGGLGAQPVARYVPFLPPLASRSRSRARRGLGSCCRERDGAPPGSGLGCSWGRGLRELPALSESAKFREEGGPRERRGAGFGVLGKS